MRSAHSQMQGRVPGPRSRTEIRYATVMHAQHLKDVVFVGGGVPLNKTTHNRTAVEG